MMSSALNYNLDHTHPSDRTINKEVTQKRMVPLLGTYVRAELHSPVYSEEFLSHFLQNIFDEIARIQSLLSYYEPKSEVSRFNRARVGEWIDISSEAAKVLQFSETLRSETQGLFNVGFGEDWSKPLYEISVSPSGLAKVRKIQKGEIDLGGIAKGFAVDQAFQKIAIHVSRGELFGSINAGGDVLVFEDRPVALGIQTYRAEAGPGQSNDQGALAVIQLDKTSIDGSKERAIATSSVQINSDLRLSYRKAAQKDQQKNEQQNQQMNHEVIVAPKTATVLAPTLMVADALTKVLLLAESPSELEWVKKLLFKFDARGMT